MPLYQEIDISMLSGGQIVAIKKGSVADDLRLKPGDELLAVNDQKVQDIIDVQYYAAEEELDLLIRRDDQYLLFEGERAYNQQLGLEFAHPTFDTQIRICNNLCEFCFVLQMAPRFRRTLYVKDDDYRYSFLYGHYVTLTNLDDHDWWRIENMNLSPLYVSVHVTDTEKRREFLRNKNAEDIMAQLRRLTAKGIKIHTQLVVVPGVNDGPILRKSAEDLAGLWPGVQSISVVPVGLTEHHKYKMRPHTKDEAGEILELVELYQTQFLQDFGARFIYATDEWYLVSGRNVPPLEHYDGQELHENGLGMVRNFIDEWDAIVREIDQWVAAHKGAEDYAHEDFPPLGKLFPLTWPYASITLATATLFAPTLEKYARLFSQHANIDISVEAINNNRLGSTITVAGLLMAEDIITQLAHSKIGDLVILPRVTFDHPDLISLDDISPQTVANRLGSPVALADTMGDVWDVLIGESKLIFYPSADA